MGPSSPEELRAGLAVGAFALLGLTVHIRVIAAQAPADLPRPLASLKTVPVPEPPNLGEFVQNRAAAIQLGKALFWDMQVGSDGVQACASCHFHAGADNRRKNQLGPGLLAGDTTFQLGGPNYTLDPEDFPLTKHQDENDPASPIVRDTNDVVSSQGVFLAGFLEVPAGSAADACDAQADPVFHLNAITTRRVEPRNTPSMVNAAFNFRNFWDGRANNEFNGVNPFGRRDAGARVWKLNAALNIEATGGRAWCARAGDPCRRSRRGRVRRVGENSGAGARARAPREPARGRRDERW